MTTTLPGESRCARSQTLARPDRVQRTRAGKFSAANRVNGSGIAFACSIARAVVYLAGLPTAAFKRNLGLRIDHILASAPLAARISGCAIDLGPRRF